MKSSPPKHNNILNPKLRNSKSPKQDLLHNKNENSPKREKIELREIKENTVKKQIQKEKEKLEINKKDITKPKKINLNINEEKAESVPTTYSLVKYDTPFLVSTTLYNKKILEELDDNNQDKEIFLRNLINKRGIGLEKNEFDDFSVRDALNKILAPKKNRIRDQLWVQYVSCNPVTKAECLTLQEELDKRLISQGARDTGICPIREELYNQCFDELIRQITINCLDRGILLMRIKKEIDLVINGYQNLFDSAIAYGVRTFLNNEEEKNGMIDKIKFLEEENSKLREYNSQLEEDMRAKEENDKIAREEKNRLHEDFVADEKMKIHFLKEDIKNKLSST